MSFQYVMYRPKKDGTSGLAANLTIKEDKCFLSVARQQPSQGENDSFSWSKPGEISDPKKNVNIKLGLPDIGAILAVLDGWQPEAKLFHKFQPKEGAEVTTQITVANYMKENNHAGYSFNILRQGEKFGWLTGFGEAEVIKTILKEAVLNQCYFEVEKKA